MSKRRDRKRAHHRDLTVVRTIRVPVAELSGVTLRRGAAGDLTLIAIGDRSAVAAWVVLPEEDSKAYAWSKVDIAAVKGSSMPERDTQIEAVCADGEGRVLLLQEEPPRVELLDWEAGRVLATVDLIVPPDDALHRSWLDPDGSRGEGVVPLANGHLLIAKEKDPPAFIEFGPPGATASGCSPGTVLAPGAPWPVPPGAYEYVALATWMPTKALLEGCSDFSDLEIGPDRRLYLLSDKSASIARLPDLRPGDGQATVERVWRMDDIEGKPEGLAFSRRGRAIVALDTPGKAENLIVLDPPIITPR
jgi:hypothetical protein